MPSSRRLSRKRGSARSVADAGTGAVVTLVALVGVALFAVLGRSAQSQTASPALSARSSVTREPRVRRSPSRKGGPAVRVSGGLCFMNADGSGKRRLAPQRAKAGLPRGRPTDARSPSEGARVGERRWERAAAPDEEASSPAWSPDGRRIAFMRISWRPGRTCVDIYVMNADGGGERKLTSGGGRDARSGRLTGRRSPSRAGSRGGTATSTST